MLENVSFELKLENVGVAVAVIVIFLVRYRKTFFEIEKDLHKAKSLARFCGYWSSIVLIVSVGSAGGIKFGKLSPQVVVFPYGIPISVALLYLGYNLGQRIIWHERAASCRPADMSVLSARSTPKP